MIAVAFASLASGAGFEVAQQGAAAGGTGHAATARTDDPALAWFNPAGLVDGGGLRAGAGASVASAMVEAASLAEGEDWYARTEPGIRVPPYLYGSWAQGPWALGLSLNVPFAGGVSWPEDWPGRFEIIRSGPTFFRVQPFFGWRVGAVSVAGGVHVDAGTLRVYKATNHIDTEGSAELALGGVGVGPHLSAHVFAGPVDIGASWKGRTRLNLSGDADFDVPDAFAESYPDQEVAARWRLPDRFALGAAGRIGRVTLLADAGLTLWSVNDALSFDFADDATPDLTQENAWRDVVSLRGGIEVRPLDPLVLRAGGYVDGLPPAVPDETLSPSSPDSRRTAVTLGVGVVPVDGLHLDAFGEYLQLAARASTSPDAIEAAYAGRAAVFGLSVGWSGPVGATREPESDSPTESDSPWDPVGG